MPTRQAIKRVDSSKVQGEGSWVELRKFTVEEALEAKAALEKGNIDLLTFNLRLIASHIVNWNWVNEKGEPLPLPSENGVMEHLLQDEVIFLAEALIGPEPETLKK